jgi:cell division protein FtsB
VLLYLMAVGIAILLIMGVIQMADFSKLNASVAKLQTDVAALLAAQPNVQPQIDAAQAAVDQIDATVVAATPTTPPTP